MTQRRGPCLLRGTFSVLLGCGLRSSGLRDAGERDGQGGGGRGLSRGAEGNTASGSVPCTSTLSLRSPVAREPASRTRCVRPACSVGVLVKERRIPGLPISSQTSSRLSRRNGSAGKLGVDNSAFAMSDLLFQIPADRTGLRGGAPAQYPMLKISIFRVESQFRGPAGSLDEKFLRGSRTDTFCHQRPSHMPWREDYRPR